MPEVEVSAFRPLFRKSQTRYLKKEIGVNQFLLPTSHPQLPELSLRMFRGGG